MSQTTEIVSTCCGATSDPTYQRCSECKESCCFIELMDAVEWLDGSNSFIDRGIVTGKFFEAAA